MDGVVLSLFQKGGPSLLSHPLLHSEDPIKKSISIEPLQTHSVCFDQEVGAVLLDG